MISRNGHTVLIPADLIDHAVPREPEDWRLDAACRELWPGHWFPPGEPREDSHQWDFPRSVCQQCPVAKECLRAALVNDERYGMWGATVPQWRARYRAARKQAQEAKEA